MLLSGCSIAVSGKFPGYTQAKLKELITSTGAKFEAGSVTPTTTHLITQPPEFDKPSQKLSDAWAKNIPSVSIGWLLGSVKENKRLDESIYLYKNPSGQAGSAQADNKKRKNVEAEKETEKPKEKSVKRQRGKKVELVPIVDDVEDAIMDGPAEEVIEKKPKGRGRQKAVKSEVSEQEKQGEVAEEPEGSRKRGRYPRRGVKLEPGAGAFPGKERDTDAQDGGALKKEGGPAKKIDKVEAVQGDIAAKEAVKEVPKKGGRLAKKVDKPESKVGTEGVPADDSAPEREENTLAVKSVDGVKAVKKKNVLIDDSCPLTATHHVYIDPSGTVFDAALNQTNIGKNNNKFYYVQLLESNTSTAYATWTHWGRVGEVGQNALFNGQTLEEARKIFEAKFKDKSGLKWESRHDAPKTKKYTLIEKNYMDEEDEGNVGAGGEEEKGQPELKPTPSSKLSPELQSLMKFIFNSAHMASSMASMRYDANKLPLGKLSKRTLSQGFAALKDLGEVVVNPALAQSKYDKPLQEVLNDLSSKYYTVIPHDFGRMRPPVIDSEEALKKEIQLVETLGDMEIANEIMKDAEYPVDVDGTPIHPLDSQFKSLNLEEAAVVDKSTTEFAELEAYLRNTQKPSGWSRRCKVVEVFRTTRPGEAERFEAGGFSADKIRTHKVNDARKLLWHGSRSTNFGGILSQGLRIAPPEAPVNGYAFGKGIYLADIASKSCEYVYPETSSNQGLLMLCEAQLGDPVYERYTHDPDAARNSKKQGALSTWAQGLTQPVGWKDAGAISPGLKGMLMPDGNKGLMNPRNMPSGAWIPDNEYIVYSVAQVKIRYLFKVDFS